jgi:uncharacterized protein
MTSAKDYIDALNLLPHPEGGWYRETYRAGETLPQNVLPKRFTGPRSFATAIYFLLNSESFSALHRIQSDELWHFYAGSPLTVHQIDADGNDHALTLGPNVGAGESFQALVPAGCWFGATVDMPESFALVGCTVAPGFDFADFELGKRAALIRRYPAQQQLIERLTRS